MYRSREKELLYNSRHKSSKDIKVCDFCQVPEWQVVNKYKFFKVIKNRFPYSLWDLKSVEEHLMLVPNRHFGQFQNMSNEEKGEFAKVLATFEVDYDLFIRATKSSIKSQIHYHVHLIKNGGRRIGGLLYSRQPYFRLSW
ncbi:hypothetical protein A2634_04795 [Candidatus Amesbacteria bacterium RIFCSPHIGHO2_01_FULL_48_32]|uniref:HIT domain-containing protein n=1 Tax=Candidatus Amesbacteria bacterium RIFCSPLOWO2_01_FULL_48_25 TaxID=1797259 RepID=A0A1F4ZEC4_9BACT|nr:MAG: hypothetical protein A2634_04795 [Candidatus Amesbacteria bacterium RIFCSPHIGHO2_01_FULL_48_32]OGD03987.1 MAG: hypothetical protein A2989_01145 [Candidatus Amesbacteria bacterium RIFCSPLOWO2_01_FULL_48_25]